MAIINYKKTIKKILGPGLLELDFIYDNDFPGYNPFAKSEGKFKNVIDLHLYKFYNPYAKGNLQLLAAFQLTLLFHCEFEKDTNRLKNNYKRGELFPPHEVPCYNNSWVFEGEEDFKRVLEVAAKEIKERAIIWFEKMSLNGPKEELIKLLGTKRDDLRDRANKD